MADIGSREGRSAFRKLVMDAVPQQWRTRVNQLLDSVVFSVEPILRGLAHFEVRSGSGAPTPSSYPDEGFGVWIDEAGSAAYVVLHWAGSFYIVGGSGAGSLPAHTHNHLTEITNAGANTHAQIDSHIANGTIHFTVASLNLDDYLRKDGTVALTGNWNAGAFEIRAGKAMRVVSESENTGFAADQYRSVSGGPQNNFNKARGTEASPVIVQSGDRLGQFIFWGYDGVGFERGAIIRAQVDGTPAANDMPARLEFLTRAPGAGSSSLRMRINSEGDTDFLAGIGLPITTQTGATLTLDEGHHTVLVDTSSNSVTINLPAAADHDGRVYVIKCIDDTNTCSIDPNGSEEIDGDSTTMTLTAMESIIIQSDGSNWWIL